MERDLAGPLSTSAALAELTALLRLAYSAELAAALAYGGHRRSLADPVQAGEVERIEVEELDHRARIARMITTLGARPSIGFELLYRVIGTTISVLCLVGGWFIPMYGAGVLESRNVTPYERAARLSVVAAHPEFVEEFLAMAEIEWDHELYFRVRRDQHWMARFFPGWTVPPPREDIRRTFEEFLSARSDG
jgi:hypothetical protein